ncbi:FKBP-type peptidyl-prolyl cis-trans isomerase [Microbacterium elymi]|uniref:Peptidyl-prolyl cis-trans isomerase n=1 Tax=Microbacterium elymi TaxID=2909587 RepID=A0ABY5NIQ2_9MICO|nr:FKBP-type peptidyl-prolyl cis-trans isomerase [Microbacterium elymi]UUT35059.1 FKBP-type peptidyl-prolyl cis-trans isomerase [Microbacterium elymi]
MVATIPGDESTAASVDVVDVLDVVPNAAWGSDVAPKDGFPTVKLAADGTPSVTLPKTDAPTKFATETLKKGDGTKVVKGDAVLVQYYGVSWNTGKVFDKSWGAQPFQFQVGQGVVQGFSDAVTGATVGSQVLAELPPSVAYGEGKVNDKDLKGQTLVFVIDILGVQHAAQ